MAQYLDLNGLSHLKDKLDSLYAKQDGSYSDMTVGLSDQLQSNVGIEDKTPYNFRTSGGSVDIGDRERVDAIVGGSLSWNQLLHNDMNSTYWGNTGSASVSFNNGVATVLASAQFGGLTSKANNFPTITTGHKVLSLVEVKLSTANGDSVFLTINSDASNNIRADATTAWQTLGTITNWDSSRYGFFRLRDKRSSNYDSFQVRNCHLFDLSVLFGAEIANYIYTLEQTNVGAGVAYFRKLFPKAFYEYNAGTLLSVKTSAHKMVGFNAYDNTSGKAKVVGGNVYQITGAYTALTLNGATITPDASGYFTPSESGDLTVTGGNATNTCIHLKWDGELDGEYEAYREWNYALDSDLELRGIPKLDANNKLYYDGDTYAPDGTVTRNYEYRAYASGDESLENAITDGTHTVVKRGSPTTEQADPYQQTQSVSDWGTEEYVDSRSIPVPVGHITFYQQNLKAKLEMAPDSPNGGDGLYVVQQISGENTYVPLVVPNEIPNAPTTDGTYVLKASVSDGTATYSWVSE